MEIPDPPYMVMRREASGKLENEVGPCETFEQALVQVPALSAGCDYVITEQGKIV